MGDADRLIDVPFEVFGHEHGTRVDVFLSRRMKRMSRSLAARVVRSGNVRREPGGAILDRPSLRVFEGERVVMRRKPLVEAPTDDLIIPILYEDERVLAVSKPGNLVVHPTASAYRRTLVRIMRERLANDRLDLAHRIDKETSGVVLMVKDSAAGSALTGQFARREVDKAYLAVIAGNPDFDRCTIEAPLRLVPDSVTSCLMEVGGPGAHPALTHVEVLARGADAALVEARPQTGRQHQIRVHLCHVGHPLLGDKLYLGDEMLFIEALRGTYSTETLVERLGHDRQALHNFRATFTHPTSQERVTVEAPPPPDLLALLARRGIVWQRSAA